MRILVELFLFLRQRKKLWMLPLILTLMLVGALFLLVEGSVIAPFIYALF